MDPTTATATTATATAFAASSALAHHPKRFIFNDDDMNHFLHSPAKANLLKLVAAMGKSCATPNLNYSYNPEEPLVGLSPPMAALHGSLTEMLSWMTDFPPTDPSQARFGNPAFRQWHERLTRRSVSMVHNILKWHQQYSGGPATAPEVVVDHAILQDAAQSGREAAKVCMEPNDTSSTTMDETDRAAIVELCAYLHDSFGHAVRLDYGTGHESSFQVFLFALCTLGCFGSTKQEPPSVERLKAVTISVYHAYLKVTRQLQTDYMLEPAGSHGVWGLDDYHCLPFYFGACQLQAEGNDVEFHSPSSIHQDRVLQTQGEKYLYFGCIRYIKRLKKGVPFFECSPMLHDISNLLTWQKVASGLLRLYEGEVLGKRQVVQHFVFGQIFAADWTPSEAPRKPPTATNFRNQHPHDSLPPPPSSSSEAPLSGTKNVAPMARAPWADETASASRGAPFMPPSTRAPWAK